MPITLSDVSDYSTYSIRGGKSFKLVPAKKSFHMMYKDIDKVLW